jgi:molybdopterin/thiamine biosynthesis adenylyltransferase/rhodanese-related sulfurtransferase
MEGLGQMVTQTFKRYDRQIILPEIGIKGQQKLQGSKVLVIGAGGLGCPILLYLAGAGVGKIGIVDDDVADLSNLHRQVLYNMTDIGRKKAEVALEKLKLLNPEIELVAFPMRLTAENAAEVIERYDLIIDGSDNFSTRYVVNDTCVALNKILVFGSIYQFEGQVSVFNFNGGPDYRSIYPEAPLPEDTQNCGDGGVTGTLPGIIGSIMANEAIKIICGFGDVLSGQLLIFNALNNDMQLFKFRTVSAKIPSAIDTVKEIGLAQLEDWKTHQLEYLLIDIREAYEFEEHNIGGINIPLYSLNDHLHEMSAHKRIVFCCSTGRRSKIAIQLIKPAAKGELFSLILK